MGSRRPPDILRKSHAHSAGKPREKGKRELEEALDESLSAQKRKPASKRKRSRRTE